jgi:hypothetical protein
MNTHKITRHAAIRMAQRGIPVQDLEFITLIGTEVNDGYLVLDADCRNFESLLKRVLQQVKRWRGKRLVISEGQVVTAYHATNREIRHLLRRSEKRNVSARDCRTLW